MRLVRLNWVARGHTITEYACVFVCVCICVRGTRVPFVVRARAYRSYRLSLFLSLVKHVPFKKYAYLYLVRDIRSKFYTRGDDDNGATSLRISSSFFSFSLSFFLTYTHIHTHIYIHIRTHIYTHAHNPPSHANIQEDRARLRTLLLAGINRLNFGRYRRPALSLYTRLEWKRDSPFSFFFSSSLSLFLRHTRSSRR